VPHKIPLPSHHLNQVLTIAYFANEFPTMVEPYVGWEIRELRRRGIRIIPGSARRPESAATSANDTPSQTLFLRPLQAINVLLAFGFALRHFNRIFSLIVRICFKGSESPARRLKALLHTWFGAYYAVLLRSRGINHIHVHHGYFGSWIAMTAARLLGVSFSITLHGSDLLLDAPFLDAKLANCKFCVTISEYNRRYILHHLPDADARKIIVSRLGVDIPETTQGSAFSVRRTHSQLRILAVGRLHVVKNHAFLIRACAQLHRCGLDFDCQIAGEGLERQKLELLIRENRLGKNVRLIGNTTSSQLDSLYRCADVVVLGAVVKEFLWC
jgi:colanic acid/amylovoran biosynthesis glycosyltransferase